MATLWAVGTFKTRFCIISHNKSLEVGRWWQGWFKSSNNIHKDPGAFHSSSPHPQRHGSVFRLFPQCLEMAARALGITHRHDKVHEQQKMNSAPLVILFRGRKAFTKKFLAPSFPLVSNDWNHVWCPSSTAKAAGKVSLKPSRTLRGSWAWKPFCVARFLFVGNRLQPPWPSLSSKGKVQTVATQGREGMQRQGRRSQDTTVQPWGRALVPPQGIHVTISLSCFEDTETPTRWEKLKVCCPQACKPQTRCNQKVDDADSHQPIRRMSTSWSHPFLWTIAIKLLTAPPGRDTQFWEYLPAVPPLPGKAIKLFFSISPKTLSLRFNSVLVLRGQILAASVQPLQWDTGSYGRMVGRRMVILLGSQLHPSVGLAFSWPWKSCRARNTLLSWHREGKIAIHHITCHLDYVRAISLYRCTPHPPFCCLHSEH